MSSSSMPGQGGSTLGAVLNRYDLLAQVGQGGAGAVYAANDRETGKKVAVKLLRQKVADDPISVKRFERELNTMRRIEHPNVVPVLDYGEYSGLPVIVMPWLDGPTLWARLHQQGAIPFEEMLEVMAPLCHAVAAIHRAGILHRDLKSANIMLDKTRGVQLLDMGLVREEGSETLTAPGHAAGTPEYMAPERITGRYPTDHRADIYALGIVFYECLTSRLPPFGRDPIAVLRAQVTGAIPDPRDMRPEIPESLITVMRTMLAKKPDDRYPTTIHVLRALRAALEQAQIQPRTPLPPAKIKYTAVAYCPDEPMWKRLKPLLELFEAKVERADSPWSLPAIMESNPKAVLWCSDLLAPTDLERTFANASVAPSSVVVTDEVARNLVHGWKVPCEIIEADPDPMSIIQVARAAFLATTRSV